LLGAVAASVTAAVAMGIGSQRWWQFITAVAVGEIVFLALVLAFALSREERHRFASFAQRVRARAASALSRRVQVDQLPVG
jgi:Mg2+/citrate symporter